MPRLLVHVEGQTEETFVQEVLRPALIQAGYSSVSARIIGNERVRRQRGGIRPWPEVRRDIERHLLGDPGCIATTMVDYYGLPSAGLAGWPGRDMARNIAYPNCAEHVEKCMVADLAQGMQRKVDLGRFLPFVMLHEFESLLFSDCGAFCSAIGKPELTWQFDEIRQLFNSPEEINDSPESAPSKRIAMLVPEYQKPLYGVLASLEIGLDVIRQQCPHFDTWYSRLVGLVQS